MRIGILGSGDAAQALGRGFAAKGHEVKLGTRDPKKLEAWHKAVGAKGTVGSVADAARHGELVVVCTLGTATEQVLDAAGVANLAGKVVVDVTNPLDFSKGMPPGNFTGSEDSLGERIQRKLPKALVVKAWNTVPNAKMVDPRIPGAKLWIAGNDAGAKKQVEALARAVGWEGVTDLGGIEAARWLEAWVPLWVRLCVAEGRWDLVGVTR